MGGCAECKMYANVLCLIFLLNAVWCSASLSEEFEETPLTSGNAPFFELPCMVIGGTCARPVACPTGTKVGQKGLCPVQQEHGIECCRPERHEVKCKSRGGECVTSSFKCPRALTIKDATDCGKTQVCCSFFH